MLGRYQVWGDSRVEAETAKWEICENQKAEKAKVSQEFPKFVKRVPREITKNKKPITHTKNLNTKRVQPLLPKKAKKPKTKKKGVKIRGRKGLVRKMFSLGGWVS